MRLRAGESNEAGILAIVKFNKPLTLGSALLITLNGSHMRGTRLLVGRNQKRLTLLTAGAVGPFPRPGAARTADAGCQRAVVASLLTARANTEGLGAEPCLLPLKRCTKRASAGRAPRRSSASALLLRSTLSPGRLSGSRSPQGRGPQREGEPGPPARARSFHLSLRACTPPLVCLPARARPSSPPAPRACVPVGRQKGTRLAFNAGRRRAAARMACEPRPVWAWPGLG